MKILIIIGFSLLTGCAANYTQNDWVQFLNGVSAITRNQANSMNIPKTSYTYCQKNQIGCTTTTY